VIREEEEEALNLKHEIRNGSLKERAALFFLHFDVGCFAFDVGCS
jgi:hypothetical protein